MTTEIKKVYSVPEMETIAFKEVEDGIVYNVPEIDCQQMIVIEMDSE